MVKLLLVLMLMTTQLLVGSGGSLYVCISHDGSFCGLDSGPESCQCSGDHDHSATRHDACLDSHCEHSSEICDVGGHHEVTETLSSFEVIGCDGCGCIHIPLMLSSDRPFRFARISLMNLTEPLGFVVALLPFWHCANRTDVLLANGRWNGPPAVFDSALAAISTTVIRC